MNDQILMNMCVNYLLNIPRVQLLFSVFSLAFSLSPLPISGCEKTYDY